MADNRAPPSQPAAMTTPALLDADLIRQHLGSRAAGFDIQVLAECPSTNSALMNAPLSQDGPVPVLVAERQTAGRGRRGREWLAWPACSSSGPTTSWWTAASSRGYSWNSSLVVVNRWPP